MSDAHIAVYVLQVKMNTETAAELYALIETCRAGTLKLQLSTDITSANVIVTNIRMRKRLERHLDWEAARQKAIVTPQWLRDCIRCQSIMRYGPYAAISELEEEAGKTCRGCHTPGCQCCKSSPTSRPATQLIVTNDSEPVILDYKAQYACQRASPLICPNQVLVNELAVLRLHRHLEGKDINALAYERAIAVVKAFPYVMVHENFEREVVHLPSLGEKMLFKIKEFLDDGVIAETRTIRSDERFQALSVFVTIHGIGPTTARHLYSIGLRTIEDLERYYDVPIDDKGKLEDNDVAFTPNGRRVLFQAGPPPISIKVALALRHDFTQTIPREEVEEMHATVMSVLDQIQPKCFSTITGGYRRGKQQSNDVDIVISHRSASAIKGLCKKLVGKLYNLGLVTHMAYQVGFHGHNALRTTHLDSLEKALIVFKLPPEGNRVQVHRRLDLIFAKPGFYWTAIMGWTGSKMFERDLRRWAKAEKGMKFDSSGLTRRRDSKLFFPQSENEIFDILGLQWIDPTLRNADA